MNGSEDIKCAMKALQRSYFDVKLLPTFSKLYSANGIEALWVVCVEKKAKYGKEDVAAPCLRKN